MSTNEGATIKDALDFAMTISPAASKEDDYAAELYPNIAAVASVYGDSEGKYAAFLKQAESEFAQEAYYFWDQPFAEEEGLAVIPSNSGSSSSPGANKSANESTKNNGGTSRRMASFGLLLFWAPLFIY
jgi:hypothetical protein